MGFSKWFGLPLAWLGGIAFTLIGITRNHPVLIHLRGAGTIVMIATCLAVIACLARRGCWTRTGLAGRWLLALWFLPLVSMLSAQASFENTKRSVLRTEPSVAQSLGRHFVVGYSDFDEVARLSEKGLIAASMSAEAMSPSASQP
jgi:beta-N-acetylhexosaminidase